MMHISGLTALSDTNLRVDAVFQLCNYVGDLRTHHVLLVSIISALQLRTFFTIEHTQQTAAGVKHAGNNNNKYFINPVGEIVVWTADSTCSFCGEGELKEES